MRGLFLINKMYFILTPFAKVILKSHLSETYVDTLLAT